MPGDWAVQELPLAVPCLGTKTSPCKKGMPGICKKATAFLTFLEDSLGISFVYIHPRIWFPIFFLDEININVVFQHVSN